MQLLRSKNPADEEQNIGTISYPIFLKKSEIRNIIEDRNVTRSINLWVETKRWGLPYAGGWAEQPAWVMDILDTIEEADIRYKEAKSG